MRWPALGRRLAPLIPLGTLVLLAACSSAGRDAPPVDPTRFGLAACQESVLAGCRRIADRTFHSVGPRQIEYHSPDGRAFLWVGDRIVRGYWVVVPPALIIPAPRICYRYDGDTAAECSPLGNKGTEPLSYREGDIYGLAKRSTAPFDLNTLPPFTSGFDVIGARIASSPVPVN